MPGYTSTQQLPYPVGTDPVRDVDNTVQQLAEKLDGILKNLVRGAGGRAYDLPVYAANTTYSARINFPAGRFASAPNVVVTPDATNPNGIDVSVRNVDTTGFDLYYRRTTTTSISFQWIALND